MKLIFKTIFVIYCLLLLSLPKAEACSEFFIDNGKIKVSGRNMDWTDDKFVVVINPRGIARQSEQVKHGEIPVKWVSKYGSVTFNMYIGGKPQGATDGMNEYGLSAAVLWMADSKYPAKDSRPVLDDGMWVQYCLDNFKTVDEIISNAPKINVVADKYFCKIIPLHLYVHDTAGNSAVLEYIDGNLVIHQGVPLSVDVLTNDPYAESLAGLSKHKGFGGKDPVPEGCDPEARFVRAAFFLKKAPELKSSNEAIKYAFSGMNDVAQPQGDSKWPTQWTVVKDLMQKKLYFKNVTNSNIRIVDLNKIDFSKEQPVKYLNIAADLSGNVTFNFKPHKSLLDRISEIKK